FGSDGRPHVVSQQIFFFQAEDGIRDRNVTGVQTCALPISSPAAGWKPRWNAAPGAACGAPTASACWRRARPTAPSTCSNTTTPRSEERRVGKEGSRRGGAAHSKKRSDVAPREAQNRAASRG